MKKIIATLVLILSSAAVYAAPAPELASGARGNDYYAQVRDMFNAGKAMTAAKLPHAMVGRTMYADATIAGDILYVRKGEGAAGPIGQDKTIISMVGEQFNQPDVYDDTDSFNLEQLARGEDGGSASVVGGELTFTESNPLGRWRHVLRTNGKYIVMRTNMYTRDGLSKGTTYSYFFKVLAR